MTSMSERLARLERMQPPLRAGRMFLLMPWDVIPKHTDRDIVGSYKLVNPDGSEKAYERTGICPRFDALGSETARMHQQGTGHD